MRTARSLLTPPVPGQGFRQQVEGRRCPGGHEPGFASPTTWCLDTIEYGFATSHAAWCGDELAPGESPAARAPRAGAPPDFRRPRGPGDHDRVWHHGRSHLKRHPRSWWHVIQEANWLLGMGRDQCGENPMNDQQTPSRGDARPPPSRPPPDLPIAPELRAPSPSSSPAGLCGDAHSRSQAALPNSCFAYVSLNSTGPLGE